jgi:hypothetical protein
MPFLGPGTNLTLESLNRRNRIPMGVGHLAASFALRVRFPRMPLFFLLAAASGFVDLLWGIAILSGLERAQPLEWINKRYGAFQD